MKPNTEKRIEALEATQPSSDIVYQAAAVARLVDNGDLVFAAGRFVAGNDAHPNLPMLADLLNVAHERFKRDQQ